MIQRLSFLVFLFCFAIRNNVYSYVIPRNNYQQAVVKKLDVPGESFYRLLTKDNPTWQVWQTIELNNRSSLQTSFFDRNRPTKIFADGWGGDIRRDAEPMSAAYFSKGEDINMILVDWLTYFNYTYPANVTVEIIQQVGRDLATFIDWLVLDNGVPIRTFHLIGHSAGVHMMGAAGAAVTTGKIPRITGLDPPNTYDINNTETRLDVTDAEFVDIMHTNGGTYDNVELAFLEPVGHVDFYVNGGRHQPGCVDVLDNGCVCSHCRAMTYFDESIVTTVGFIGLRCDNYDDFVTGLCAGNDKQYMGEYTPSTARGTYYLDTNLEAPFAKG